VLVFFMFPKHAREKEFLAEYQRADAAARIIASAADHPGNA